MSTLRLDPDDAALFRRASHDCNPLHVDATYARRTAFGEPVVYGALGGLALLGQLADQPGLAIRELTMEFRNPIFVGTRYTVSARWDPRRRRAVADLQDGRRTVTRVTASYGEGLA